MSCNCTDKRSVEQLAIDYFCSQLPREFIENEKVTVTDTSTPLGTIPAGATGAIIQVWGADIAYRLDGTDATTTPGENFRANDGSTIQLDTAEKLANFRAIRLAGVNAELYVQYTKVKES